MTEIVSLIEAYLTAERDLVAAVDAAGGAVPLPDGRAVTVGRAEFDAVLYQVPLIRTCAPIRAIRWT